MREIQGGDEERGTRSPVSFTQTRDDAGNHNASHSSATEGGVISVRILWLQRERGGKRERVTRERALCTRRTNLAEKGQKTGIGRRSADFDVLDVPLYFRP